MNILKNLSELADALDKKGLYAEASELDEIIKEAVGVMPPGQGMGGMRAPTYTLEEAQYMEKENQRNKVGKIQERFNRLYDRLSQFNTPEQMRSMFGDRLVVDKAWGPKTDAAYKKLSQMRDMLKQEVANKQNMDFVWPAPGEPVMLGTPEIGKPEAETGVASTAPLLFTVPTDQEIMREVSNLSNEVKSAGGNPLDIHNMIKEVNYLMNEGKDLRGALDELRMRMMGA